MHPASFIVTSYERCTDDIDFPVPSQWYRVYRRQSSSAHFRGFSVNCAVAYQRGTPFDPEWFQVDFAFPVERCPLQVSEICGFCCRERVSRHSHRTCSMYFHFVRALGYLTVFPHKQMKASSRAPTACSTAPEETPMSPSRRSRAGSKSQSQSRVATDYPPLPPSTMLSPSGRTNQLPTSPRSHHRAPSISPSDSPSQAPLKARRKVLEEREKLRSVVTTSQVNEEVAASKRASPPIISGNPMSPSHQSRPFSPYRHAPTNEDLLFAASAAAAKTQKAVSQVGSQVASQVHSQVNGGGSKISHVSQHTHITQQSHHTQLMQRTHHSCQSRSQRSQAPCDGDDVATPTPSRPPSPSFSLNAAEEAMVAQALAARGAGDRTSYAPSALEPDIVNSHFHDMDLCILLHQMDDLSTHEVVKKALRKAVRQRVKRLGMKYDAEVSILYFFSKFTTFINIHHLFSHSRSNSIVSRSMTTTQVSTSTGTGNLQFQ